jgi:uncharacterized membrane protein YphA (DoxX/SURF4 family)
MRIRMRDVPTRFATGAYILHSGLGKWHGTDEQAEGVHRMAAGAFPLFEKLSPKSFLKTLALAEIGVGTLLLTPIVPNAVAGAALSTFAGGLVTMYLRTPALHEPHSVWPTPAGIGVSKEVWMLGIGLGLLADGRDGAGPYPRCPPVKIHRPLARRPPRR